MRFSNLPAIAVAITSLVIPSSTRRKSDDAPHRLSPKNTETIRTLLTPPRIPNGPLALTNEALKTKNNYYFEIGRDSRFFNLQTAYLRDCRIDCNGQEVTFPINEVTRRLLTQWISDHHDPINFNRMKSGTTIVFPRNHFDIFELSYTEACQKCSEKKHPNLNRMKHLVDCLPEAMPLAVEFLKDWEKLRTTAYYPVKGDPLTIGYGHVGEIEVAEKGGKLIRRPIRLGDVISEKYADELLESDIIDAFKHLLSHFGNIPMTPLQLSRFISFQMNTGVFNGDKKEAKFITENFLVGNWESLSDTFLTHNTKDGIQLNGLTKRRRSEFRDICPASFVNETLADKK